MGDDLWPMSHEPEKSDSENEETFRAIRGLIDRGAIMSIYDLGQTRVTDLRAVFTEEQLRILAASALEAEKLYRESVHADSDEDL